MQMPPLDPAILARRSEIVAALRAIVPGEGVVDDQDGMRPYECDALSAYRQMPLVVVLPETVAQVSAILHFCQANKVKLVPRGGGTSLSGGSMPVGDAVLLAMGKFNRVLEIDYANRCARVQPGVTNLGITKAVEHEGFYYAPDPSSQIACSIGGNVAENSGGVHCLKYGLTTNNLLGLELVLMNGEVVRLGGKHLDSGGYDLMGLMTGSEGLLGVVTEVTVRLLRKPSTARAVLLGFPTEAGAADCVAAVIASGIIPGGMEMMDRDAVKCAEAYVGAGYPLDVEGLLIVELDGPPIEVDYLVERVSEIARGRGATTIRVSHDEPERMLFWAGRKAAFPAVGQISPDYMCLDGSVPRGRLVEVLAGIRQMSKAYGLRVVNVFHAGDGNLHPLILFDANDPHELHRAEQFGADILRLCVKVGGVLTGEHGVGIEKRDLMGEQFTEIDLDQQMRVKCAFDPDHLLNPGKVFPKLRRCAELGQMVVHHNKLPFPDIPRF
ncbi:MAG: FAD-linked oxidase C-terminal domain-containing protein [Reyranella sp.]|uniref:FAD-linked oxidase C-terminal domain-containing protein n=1 Tax=Reyranella sp. TaxID=1929291 RepID=UPI003D11AA23